MRSSAFSRSVELAKLAARVGFKELRSGDLKSRMEQAVVIANSLSHLKGAAMKAGQLLSLDLSDYFPPEAIQVLSQLQNAARAQPFTQIEEILRHELGPERLAQVHSIAEIPIGVASIGQVHRARFQDQDIVLKVQYPGVSESIDSDLKILKTLANSFLLLSGRQMSLDSLFAEFRSVLQQETDYRFEAQLQNEYRTLIQTLPPSSLIRYRVPEVLTELSTANVLALTFENGLTLRSWMATNPTSDRRESLAHAFLDLYFHEFFAWGLVQTDPNWANFLIADDGTQTTLVLLDFGATRRYSRQFIQDYIRLLALTSAGDSSGLKKHAIKFGLLDPRESSAAFVAFEQLLRTAIEPFFPNAGHENRFDFADKDHTIDSQKAGKALADELKYSPPPYGLIFLHRKLGGVYSILKHLNVKLDVTKYWQQMMGYAQ